MKKLSARRRHPLAALVVLLLALGSLGPVTEGLFGWIFGLGSLIAIAIWVAAHTTKARKS